MSHKLTQWDNDAEDYEEVVPEKSKNKHLEKEINRIVNKKKSPPKKK